MNCKISKLLRDKAIIKNEKTISFKLCLPYFCRLECTKQNNKNDKYDCSAYSGCKTEKT